MARGKSPSLGALFLFLTIAFAGVAYTAARAGGTAWIVAVAAALLGLWMAEMAYKALR